MAGRQCNFVGRIKHAVRSWIRWSAGNEPLTSKKRMPSPRNVAWDILIVSRYPAAANRVSNSRIAIGALRSMRRCLISEMNAPTENPSPSADTVARVTAASTSLLVESSWSTELICTIGDPG